MFRQDLQNGYEIRELETEPFGKLWEEHGKRFFDDSQQIFRFRETLNASEEEKAKTLREKMGQPFRLNLGLYFTDEFVLGLRE